MKFRTTIKLLAILFFIISLNASVNSTTGNIFTLNNINFISGTPGNILTNDDSYWMAGRNNSEDESLDPAGYFNITYNLSSLNLERREQVLNITLNTTYCHSSAFLSCTSLLSGTIYENSMVEIFNSTSLTWQPLTSLSLANGSEQQFNHTLISSLSDFINSEWKINIRYQINFTINANGEDALLALDYSGLDINYDNNKPSISTYSISGNATLLDYISINITSNDTYLKNISTYLYNSSGQLIKFSSINTSSMQESIIVNFTNILPGKYYFNTTAFDMSGNQNSTTTQSITIYLPIPDLEVQDVDISISSLLPREGDLVQINATVHNRGGLEAENIIAAFYLGDPQIDGILLINYNLNLSAEFGSQNTVTLNTSFNVPGPGPFNFFVVLDPPTQSNGSINETNEENNAANITVNVPGYQIYYGQMSKNIVLGKQDDVIYSKNANNVSGNILALASGRNFSLTSFQALGRTVFNTTASQDFAELDISLNMTGYYDSISLEYTLLTGTPLQTANMTLFNREIQHVPVANSTNTSNFITGIVWDMSDGGDEYNGSQDVVFLTQVNNDKQGAYGNYDFEIKVPVALKITNASTIDLYTEITS
jgi:hypothetical protein